jgi:hypothetical protein
MARTGSPFHDPPQIKSDTLVTGWMAASSAETGAVLTDILPDRAVSRRKILLLRPD